MNSYINQYQTNQVATASQEQILIMLYDGAIRFAKLACQAIDSGSMADKGKYVGKTMAIVSEFANSLNFEIGGEIAENLDALYSFMLRELSKANVENSKEPIETVITLLSDLRETWLQAIEVNSGQQQTTDEGQQLPEKVFANSSM